MDPTTILERFLVLSIVKTFHCYYDVACGGTELAARCMMVRCLGCLQSIFVVDVRVDLKTPQCTLS